MTPGENEQGNPLVDEGVSESTAADAGRSQDTTLAFMPPSLAGESGIAGAPTPTPAGWSGGSGGGNSPASPNGGNSGSKGIRPPSSEPTLSDSKAGDPASVSVPGYEILKVLGRGGMGVVYQARHQTLKRTVALKMILAGGHAGANELARFRTEAEAVARLVHPNIVQIHEVGESGGHPYFAIEFVGGGSLDRKLDGKPMVPSEAAKLIETLARAMQFAHNRNVIHRDLKPANVLLMDDGTPKVNDFGLARQLDLDSGETQAGMIMGTPSYMAPEQASGQSHEAGPSADIYALGAILYECLAGKPPFKGNTVIETLELVQKQDPVAPSKANPRIPVDLETIALKCLRKEPENRYASAGELADDLRRYRRGEPVVARPVGQLERAWFWCRRNPAIASLTAGIAISLVIGALVALSLAIFAFDRASLAESHAKEASKAREEADRDRKKALESAADATRLRDIARTQLAEANHRIYIGDMRAAMGFASQGKTLRLLQFLLLHRTNFEELDSRGWEWYYLFGFAGSTEQVFTGHREGTDLLEWNPRGGLLASASSEAAGGQPQPPVPLKVWNRETNREQAALHGAFPGVSAVAWSKDGTLLASATANGQIQLWNLRQNEPLKQWKAHAGPVTGLSISPDGKRLATTGNDKVAIWSLPEGRELSQQNTALRLADASWNAEGSALVYGRADGSIVIGRGSDAAPVQHLTPKKWADPSHKAPRFSWNLQSDRIVWECEPGTVQETALSDGRIGKELWRGSAPGIPMLPFTQMAASADGNTILAGNGVKIFVWSKASGPHPIWEMEGSQFALDATCGLVAVLKNEETRIWIYDLARKEAIRLLAGHENTIHALAWEPGKRRLASASKDRTVRVWDLSPEKIGAQPFKSARIPDNPLARNEMRAAVTGLAVSPEPKSLAPMPVQPPVLGQRLGVGIRTGCCKPDGSRMALGFSLDAIHFWDPWTDKIGPILETGALWPKSKLVDCEWSPSGALLSIVLQSGAGKEKKIILWDIAKAKIQKEIELGEGDFRSHHWSPQSDRLAIGFRDGLEIRDASTGKPLHTQKWPHQNLYAWSADGEFLAIAVSDGTRVYSVKDGSIRTFLPELNEVTSLAFSPDGKTLAAASWRKERVGEIWFCALAEGAILKGKGEGHVRKIEAMGWSPDGKRLISIASGETKLWEPRNGGEILTFAAENRADAALPENRTGTARDMTMTVFWSADGRKCGWATFGSIQEWDAEPGHRAAEAFFSRVRLTDEHGKSRSFERESTSKPLNLPVVAQP